MAEIAASTLVAEDPAVSARVSRSPMAVYVELTKARLSALVVMTTGLGFVLASPHSIEWARLGWALLGTALAAFGANALNQWWEVERDRRMRRTRQRPLPAGRISSPHALLVGITLATAGPAVLLLTVNMLTAALGLACALIYVLAYTPLKVRHPTNTLVGAICGAIPPMMGWAAASGGLGAGAWMLGILLFLWQIPHFLALAWLYRDDYARGGFRMLPAADPRGQLTFRLIFTYSLALLPLGVAFAAMRYTGWFAAVGALALGVGMVWCSVLLRRERTDAAARRVFLASVLYLPLLMLLMMADRVPTA